MATAAERAREQAIDRAGVDQEPGFDRLPDESID